ncbi:hypothetical protein L1887_39035 [Cichorium endivia]|nr:hypothetical protein L1887_39035 [Cichorium endivia]
MASSVEEISSNSKLQLEASEIRIPTQSIQTQQFGVSEFSSPEGNFKLEIKSSPILEPVNLVSSYTRLNVDNHEISLPEAHNSYKMVIDINKNSESSQFQQKEDCEKSFSGYSIPLGVDNRILSEIDLFDVNSAIIGHDSIGNSGLVDSESIFANDSSELVQSETDKSIDMETDIKLNMKLRCNSILEDSIANAKTEESNSGVITVSMPVDLNSEHDRDGGKGSEKRFSEFDVGTNLIIESVYKGQNSSEIPMELVPTVQNADAQQGLEDNVEKNKSHITTIESDSSMQKDKHQKSVESKSFAQIVDANSSTLNATIKVIPKTNGSKIGEVEMSYSNLMLGSAPYHSTLYGFFVDKPPNFNSVRYFASLMWKNMDWKT